MVSDDKVWHLAEDETEMELTDVELQLWRVLYGFLRWQEECQNCANEDGLNAYDLAILHIIRMQDRPKTMQEICRLLNREDVLNVQYVIKKLLKSGLIERDKSKKFVGYRATEQGINNTEKYKVIRKNILVDMYARKSEFSLKDLAEKLAAMKGIYDEAVRITATYKRKGNEDI